MDRAVIGLVVAACFYLIAPGVVPASAQTPVEEGTLYQVPPDKRETSLTLTPGSKLEIGLDDQFGLATLLYLPAPDQIDLPVPELSRTEETLVRQKASHLSNTPGTVALTLFVQGDQSFLKVENNTEAPIAYLAAFMLLDEDSPKYYPSETCMVPAHKLTVEAWPRAIDGVGINRFLRPPPSDKIMCVDPKDDLDNPRWYSLDAVN